LSTINVAVDECYTGTGSKQTILARSGMVVMKVASNVVAGVFHKTAVIENLIIDGKDANGGISVGSVGILLQNVYNCVIRNVTILNCEVGIKIENTGSYWSQSNRIEHVRMENVKTGILFSASVGNSGDFGFTTIKDVGIKLSETAGLNVGIQIGTSENFVAKLYSSFIKATVWISDREAGYGMRIYGELKYSLVMFAVECPGADKTVSVARVGVGISNLQNGAVFDNQSFMLSYGTMVISLESPFFLNHDIVTEAI